MSLQVKRSKQNWEDQNGDKNLYTLEEERICRFICEDNSHLESEFFFKLILLLTDLIV